VWRECVCPLSISITQDVSRRTLTTTRELCSPSSLFFLAPIVYETDSRLTESGRRHPCLSRPPPLAPYLLTPNIYRFRVSLFSLFFHRSPLRGFFSEHILLLILFFNSRPCLVNRTLSLTPSTRSGTLTAMALQDRSLQPRQDPSLISWPATGRCHLHQLPLCLSPS
jgi:hypothetical protein